jgi:hypothetical protein
VREEKGEQGTWTLDERGKVMRRLLCVALVAAVSLVFAPRALAGFGLQRVAVAATNRDGSPDVQAGSHPYAVTGTIVLNKFPLNEEETHQEPAGQGSLKDVVVELPPGFVGDPNATPKCSYAEFTGRGCKVDTVVGIETTWIHQDSLAFPDEGGIESFQAPVYNMEPSPGVPAEFAFEAENTVKAFLNASVRTGGDYGLNLSASNVSQAASIYASKITIWGVPGEASHDTLRGTGLHGCMGQNPRFGETGLAPGEDEQEDPGLYESKGECPVDVPVQPFLTNPTSCGVSRTTNVTVESWQEPLLPPIPSVSASTTLPPLEGCEKLDFSPTIDVTPDGSQGSTPTGLNVDLHVPQESTQNPDGLGEADVQNITVALPEGVQLSPSAADGLEACSDAQIGYEPELSTPGHLRFTSGKPSCPNASKLANVRVKTPLLEQELEGAVYLAAPQNYLAGPLENPFESLVALYLVAEDPVAGVLIKLAGKVELNKTTGQIVTTFENIPQLPFSESKLEFYGTDRAPLSTPILCGTYKTEASIVPWSGTGAVVPSSNFQITSGPAGAPCSDPPPFTPEFNAETTNIQAGGYTPFVLNMTRPDGDQTLNSIEMQMPPGLLGSLSNVKLCPEAQANAGTCGEESLIGHTIVSAGLGNDPFTVTGGKVYVTVGYGGAPYGLSIVNPAAAGPFVLQEGRPVIVRAQIFVNVHTAALTVKSGPLPTILDGVPLQIQHVNVTVERPGGFTFNPTNCDPMAITGTITSSEGARAGVSSPFQVTNCATLAFDPKFAVSTSGKTSKADGASLAVKLTYPAGADDANIAKAKVDLPKQLPSRLTTLQKACVAAVFEANPANCPAASIVGHARAVTPVIPVPLEGPAYFVSHGGEKFPSLIIVLQGYGVTVDLVGTTFISKAGITSSTFEAVPDVPVGTFELTLPEGPYSALAANGNLCKSKLNMPTAFVAQNGAVINQDTHIEVEGCADTISVVSHKVKGKTTTIQVSVPAAGKVIASGKGVSRGSKTASGRETVSLVVEQKKAGKLKTKVKLTFTPRNGEKQSKSVTVEFKK